MNQLQKCLENITRPKNQTSLAQICVLNMIQGVGYTQNVLSMSFALSTNHLMHCKIIRFRVQSLALEQKQNSSNTSSILESFVLLLGMSSFAFYVLCILPTISFDDFMIQCVKQFCLLCKCMKKHFKLSLIAKTLDKLLNI